MIRVPSWPLPAAYLIVFIFPGSVWSAQVWGGPDRLGVRAPSGSRVYVKVVSAKMRPHTHVGVSKKVPSMTGELPHPETAPSRKGGWSRCAWNKMTDQKQTKSDRGGAGGGGRYVWSFGGFVLNVSRKPNSSTR